MHCDDARSLADETLRRHDLENWSVRFDRAVTRVGACFYRKRLISLSRRFVERNDDALVEDTIRHEVAHALAWERDGATGHGEAWKKWCEVTGASPRRCFAEEEVVLPEPRYRCTVLASEVAWSRGSGLRRRTGTTRIGLPEGSVFGRFRMTRRLRWAIEIGMVEVFDTKVGKTIRSEGGRGKVAALLLAVLTLSMPATGRLSAQDVEAGLIPALFEAPPTIDGRLDDPAWEVATRVAGFFQVEPFQGEPSPVMTEVLVGYDDEALYFGFRMEDPEPERIAAAVTTRDGDGDNDDTVAVMLDTFRSGDSGYYFASNLLGTQFDGTIANNGRTEDDKWDAAWQNASALVDGGWTAEFRIPFEVLRYAAGDEAVWGVNFLRLFPRRKEASVWSGPGESVWRVSVFAPMTGWSPPRSSTKWWQIIPYVLGVGAEGGENDGEVGGDVRLRYRSALIADLTLNPDFALVEADVEQINLTRFELSVPEKRPFFLEGNERFEQRIQQFYSRRIGDIDWGAKVAGTAGNIDYIALGTQAELFSLDDEGLETSFDADYGVLRLQSALKGKGNLGVLAASRRLEGEEAGSVGLDSTLFFTDKVGMTAQYLRTHGPGENGAAWFLRPAYDSVNSHFHVRYTNLDAGIRDNINAVGFLRDDNRREWDTNVSHSWWFEESFFERVNANVNYNRYYGQDGVLRSYETRVRTRVDFSNNWGFNLRYEDEFQRFEEDFHNHRFEIDFGWDNRQGRFWGLEVSKGENFGDDLWLYEGDISWKISDAWNIGYDVLHLDLDPDLENRSTWIHVLRSTYYFTNDLFVKLFAQTNTAIDKENIQLLGVWRISPPFGSLQFAYQRGTSALGEQSSQGNTLFLKLAWVF